MKKVSNHTLRWLYRVPGRKKGYILMLLIIQMLSGASGVLYALLMRNIVDSAVAKDLDGFTLNVCLVIGLVLLQISMSAAVRFLGELSRSTFENTFKERLLSQLLQKNYSCIEAVHSGEWLNRLTSDTQVAANGYTEIIPGIAGMIVKMVSAVIMIIVLQPWFTWVIIPGGIVMILLTYSFRRILKKLHKNVQEKDGRLRIFLQETLGNMMMIRAFAAQKQTSEEMSDKTGDHKNARMRKNRFSNFCNVGFAAAINGMYLFGVCWCGWGILMGLITYGTLTAVTQLIAQIQSPIANISGFLPRFYAMTASAERLMEIEAFESDCTEEPLPLEDVNEYYDSSLVSVGLDKAGFTYYPHTDKLSELAKDNMPVVFSNMSFEIRKGEYAAFVGHSGCGKSTAIKLLLNIYTPDEGRCFIRSHDEQITLDSKWHRLFAYVPQGNKLMTGTVRDAVVFADRSRINDDEAIRQALRVACADEFVDELEDGVDTVLGERGTGLSEGQMQRIAIARAIFSGCPILILDEATSSLDSSTEQRLLKNLRDMTDKTVIIVTHRPAVLDICDKVLSFTEDGITVTPGKVGGSLE